MKVNVITMLLFNKLIESGNILPIPGIANTDSVITDPLIHKIHAPVSALTIVIMAYFRIWRLIISLSDTPLALANFT